MSYELKNGVIRQVDTYWEGKRCRCEIVRIVVAPPPAPTWWCAMLTGTVREVVKVYHGDVPFYLDNEAFKEAPAGGGWRKVTEGQGSPRFGHRQLFASAEVKAS